MLILFAYLIQVVNFLFWRVNSRVLETPDDAYYTRFGSFIDNLSDMSVKRKF